MDYNDTCELDMNAGLNDETWEDNNYKTDENYKWDDGFKWDKDHREEENFTWSSEENSDDNYSKEDVNLDEDYMWDWNTNINSEESFGEQLLPQILHSKLETEGGQRLGALQELPDLQALQGLQDLEAIRGPQGPQGPPGPAAECLKEICVRPIQHILEQLLKLEAGDIEIGTEKQGTILEARILNIENSLVSVQTPYNYIVIPIYQIVGIYSRSLPQITLLPVPQTERRGDCEYCERPLREYFATRIGKNFTINTSALDELFRGINGTITRIGEGIIILNDTVAVLIHKIISVEKNKKDRDSIEC
ncbi:hypothetical protein GOM49_11780 [Clostridium bovifaecis]|uniref:Uncharacterized protein n=1 Tax=Clostridium bovifaecis TaxID=2184719 RepID=A0A6I6F5L7_9CLOT|nr:hypothetical protein GOM49_11780 [Clostridium bovifaecis]